MKVNGINSSAIRFDFLSTCGRNRILKDLSDVSLLYPNFESWLTFKFLRNLPSGERKLLIAHDGDNAMGYALLKQDARESKICTFFILEKYRSLGLGKHLMAQSLEILNSSETFITVADERLDELTPLLKSKGFTLSKSVPDMYREGVQEHFWSI